MIERQILTWLLTADTGQSSKAMARAVLGIPGGTHHPYDPSDVARCIGLLDAAPGIKANEAMVQAIAGMSPQWASLVDAWGVVEAATRKWMNEEDFGEKRLACWLKASAIIQDVLKGQK